MNRPIERKLHSINTLAKSDLRSALESCSHLLQENEDNIELLVLFGRLLRWSRNFLESEKVLQHALVLDGKDVLAHNELGQLLLQTGSYRLAAEAFLAAADIVPDNPGHFFNCAFSQQQNGQYSAAIKSYQTSLSLGIENPIEAIAQIAQLHIHLGNNNEALIAIQKGNSLSQVDHGGLCFAEGMLAAEEGDQKRAEEAFRKTVQADTKATGALIELFRARQFSQKDDPDIRLAEKWLSNTVDPIAREQLSFALGKALDECGDHKKAFEHFKTANQLKVSRHPPFKVNKHRSMIGQLIRSDWPISKVLPRPGPSPIFILGMPRSGTSLVEQIISSHPNVYGAGELEFFATINTQIPEFPFHGLLAEEQVDQLRTNYTELLHSASNGEDFVTDKYPGNFLHIGIIQQLFPNCRIIHCQRDAIDTCLSVFFQDFPQGHLWTNSLDNIAEYYKQYERLMAHWCRLFPDQILSINYSGLVTDQKSVTLDILKHCGLSWHDDCLDFTKNKRKVSTLSNWQVRRDIYQSSLNRKKHYLPWINTLVTFLDKGS